MDYKSDNKERLIKLLHTLKTNREKVPEEILATRYKDAYNGLLTDIVRCGKSYAIDTAISELDDIRGSLEDAVELYEKELKEIFAKISERSDYSRQLGKALNACDIDRVEEIARLAGREFKIEAMEFIENKKQGEK